MEIVLVENEGREEDEEEENGESEEGEEEAAVSPRQVLAPNARYLIITVDEEEMMHSDNEREVDSDGLSVLESDGGMHSGSRNWTQEELTILLKYIFRKINTRKVYDLGLIKSA